MYLSYFGLQQSPFRTAPDPDSFFASRLHRRAVDRVVHSIRERAGLILVLGEIGQGKTTVCRYIQTRYENEFVMGYLGNPFLHVQAFEQQILHEFGLSSQSGGAGESIRLLTGFLREQDAKGRVVVLFLDEAHLLRPDVLEFLLIITNIQHQGRHLLQMVLAGQNEFQEILCQPRFSSLNQRLGNRIMVADLGRDDVAAYIRFRWDQAGGAGKDVFSQRAVAKIWEVTRGNPRLINQVCEALLQNGYERRAASIHRQDVVKLCKHAAFKPILHSVSKQAAFPLRRFLVAGTLALVLVGGGAVLLLDKRPMLPGISFFFDAHQPAATVSSSHNKVSKAETSKAGTSTAGTSTAGASTAGANKSGATSVKTSDAGEEPPHQRALSPQATRQEGPASGNTQEIQAQAAEPKGPAATPPVLLAHDKESEEARAVTPQAQSEDHRAAHGTWHEEESIQEPALPEAPGVEVNAIVWDALPRFRLAVVNEHIVKQGDQIKGGYTLEAILPESIRLSRDGRIFGNRVHHNERTGVQEGRDEENR